LKQLIGATFGVPAGSVPDDAAVGEFAPWNSLGHLELMMALEAEYQIVIPTERMIDLSSIDAIEDYLATQQVFEKA
jgi:acyl carrier protein